MDANDNGNGKVTLAILSTKLDHLIDMQKAVVAKLDRHTDDIKCLEKHDERQDEKIDQMESRVKSWNLLNSFGVVAASIMAIWGKPN